MKAWNTAVLTLKNVVKETVNTSSNNFVSAMVSRQKGFRKIFLAYFLSSFS